MGVVSEVTVHHGDGREVLKTLADESVDSCVCDPPYALVSIGKRFGKTGAAPAKSNGASGVYRRSSSGFMGQKWDNGEAAHSVELWAEVFRVLKPGGHVVAFSGTRTQHRQVCAIEDAGFEIRDAVLDIIASDTAAELFFASLSEEQQRAFVKLIDESTFGGMLGWLFGSGFPKSHNQKGEWDGWGSALKPAWEPICLARKPLVGTIAANLEAHRCGALNIDASRVSHGDAIHRPSEKGAMCGESEGWCRPWQADQGARDARVERAEASIQRAEAQGRWPANVIHDGSDEVIAAFPDAPGQQQDIDHNAPSAKTSGIYGKMNREGEASSARRYADKGSTDFAPLPGQRRGDSGSAARFFYSAKAGAEDRLGSKHPTVKPIDLMAWLCRLVTPPGGLVLDPFAGTGTTGLAAMRGGFDCILIEREAEYVADINRRIAWANGAGRLTVMEQARDIDHGAAAGNDLPLFATNDTAQPASQPASVSSTGPSPATAHRGDGDDEMVAA